MHLIRLIYSSIARQDLGFDDYLAIRKSAVTNNAAAQLRGILCVQKGTFLQVLEGRRSVVSATFNRIVRDPRHTGVELMLCDPISTCAFDDWSMKMIGGDLSENARRRQLMHTMLGMEELDRDLVSGPQVFNFLHQLVAQERQLQRSNRAAAAALAPSIRLPAVPKRRKRTESRKNTAD